ncbi:hypothetical protein [Rhizobium halophilum]|uniref:hypothetical protein n=1 Tax=Rhizobium halophilum TaxID=2846852 RepID=UPI001EFE6917|nr:hypothetical protein [Rhizobium halophilum]MCF6367274.1 hypothetical protein [Rhizobium halophilum]
MKGGLPLEALHRRITAELLPTARYALLVDAATESSDLPWLAGYSAEALIDWAADRMPFVLDESGLAGAHLAGAPAARVKAQP